MKPRPFRVMATRVQAPGTVTLSLEPLDGIPLTFSAGQFTMVGTLAAGEAPISISGGRYPGSRLEQTVRDAGGVTHTLATARTGEVLTVRGPYGTGWRTADGAGGDVVIVAGGIGLAPLRTAVLDILARRDSYRDVSLLYGARSPGDRVFADDLSGWARRIAVLVTVDRASPDWTGPVGLVTELIPAARFDPARTLALVCGPEVMIRVVAAALADAGVPTSRIRVSLERNMECGIGLCGHCQLREFFICTDGPVFRYEQVAGPLTVREY